MPAAAPGWRASSPWPRPSCRGTPACGRSSCPATNTATMTKISMLMKPTPTPPKMLFSHMPTSGISPPSGVSESCIALTEPFEVDGRRHRPERRQPGAERGPPCPPSNRSTGRRPCAAIAGLPRPPARRRRRPSAGRARASSRRPRPRVAAGRSSSPRIHDHGHRDDGDRPRLRRSWRAASGSRTGAPSSARSSRRRWCRAA